MVADAHFDSLLKNADTRRPHFGRTPRTVPSRKYIQTPTNAWQSAVGPSHRNLSPAAGQHRMHLGAAHCTCRDTRHHRRQRLVVRHPCAGFVAQVLVAVGVFSLQHHRHVLELHILARLAVLKVCMENGAHRRWQQTDNATGCENGTGKSFSWGLEHAAKCGAHQHGLLRCCDAASMHPALCALGAGACEHRGRQRRPSHRRRAVDGMRSGAPHSTALAVAPHLRLQNWQRQGPRRLQCGVHQRKRSSSGSGSGALLRCRSQHRGRGQVEAVIGQRCGAQPASG